MRVLNSGLKVRLALLKVGLSGKEFASGDIAQAAGVPDNQARHYLKPSKNRYAEKVNVKPGRGRPSGLFKLSSSGRLLLLEELSAISPELVPGGIYMHRFVVSLSELEVAAESIHSGTAFNVKETVRFAANALRSARRALTRMSDPDGVSDAQALLETALEAFRGLPVEQSLLVEDQYFPTADSLSNRKSVSIDDASLALSAISVNPTAANALLIVESIFGWVMRLEPTIAVYRVWSAFIYEVSQSLTEDFPKQAADLENLRSWLAGRINKMQLDNLPIASTTHMAAKKHAKKTDDTVTTSIKKKAGRKTQLHAAKAEARIPTGKRNASVALAAKRRAAQRELFNKRRGGASARPARQHLEHASGRR